MSEIIKAIIGIIIVIVMLHTSSIQLGTTGISGSFAKKMSLRISCFSARTAIE